MSDEEIRITIAEACGWRCVHIQPEWECGDKLRGMPPKSNLRDRVPDYCNDLNAMHEAEMLFAPQLLNTKMDDRRWCDYVVNLGEAVKREKPYGSNIHATARQRCEAFLRTLGKWPTTVSPEKNAPHTSSPS